MAFMRILILKWLLWIVCYCQTAMPPYQQGSEPVAVRGRGLKFLMIAVNIGFHPTSFSIDDGFNLRQIAAKTLYIAA
jgi:hypothetical protein